MSLVNIKPRWTFLMSSLVEELGSYSNPIVKIWQLSNFFKICLSYAKIYTKRDSIYTNMISNESLGYNLSNEYKLYVRDDSKNFVEAKILPLPLQKLRKMTIFYRKLSINYYFKLNFDFCHIKPMKYIIYNKTSTNKWP